MHTDRNFDHCIPYNHCCNTIPTGRNSNNYSNTVPAGRSNHKQKQIATMMSSKPSFFGNHKEANNDPILLQSLVINNITHGYSLPLPLDKITKLSGVTVSPMNITRQETINEHGKIVPKQRLTHDQSYEFTSLGSSINSRVDKTKLTPCFFGWTLAAL